MFDHVGFAVADLAQSKAFFLSALAPLGVRLVMEGPYGVGIGKDGKPSLWLHDASAPAAPMHLAFTARTRDEVIAFHAAALQAGGKDNGAPGLRPQYHANYYGAYLRDPDGNNVEAVHHCF